MKTLCEAVHNHIRCSGWIYRCKDCGSTGCSNNSCPSKSFKDRKCLSCGSRSTETIGDYERRMRNEKDAERKRSDNEKRNSRNESLSFGAGISAGSFISKRNQKKLDKELERLQELDDSLTPNREDYQDSFQSTEEYLENQEYEEEYEVTNKAEEKRLARKKEAEEAKEAKEKHKKELKEKYFTKTVKLVYDEGNANPFTIQKGLSIGYTAACLLQDILISEGLTNKKGELIADSCDYELLLIGTEEDEEDNDCPECGCEMNIENGKNGKIYNCPDCGYDCVDGE